MENQPKRDVAGNIILHFHPEYPEVGYEIQQGKFYRILIKNPEEWWNYKISRELVPDEKGYLHFSRNKVDKKHIPMVKKACILAWEIITKSRLDNDESVYHKNADEGDYRGYNLALIPRNEIVAFREAIYNLEQLKITKHKEDVHKYIIKFKSMGDKTRTFNDYVSAQSFKRLKQIAAAKHLSKFYVTD